MASLLESKYYILRRWLKDPSVEYNVWTLSSRTGLGEVMVRRLLTELEQDGLVQVQRKAFPLRFRLLDPARARDELRSPAWDPEDGDSS